MRRSVPWVARVLVALISLGLVAIGIVALLAPGAAAAPAATISPPDDLVDLQIVRVDWSDFPAGDAVTARQCKAAPTSEADCTVSVDQVSIGASRADGTGTVFIEIRYGELAAPGGAFTCDENTACTIGLFHASQNAPLAAPELSFAIPPSSCPLPTGERASGSGASTINRAMFSWLAAVCRPPSELSVAFSQKNGPGARIDFVNGLTDFGATPSPFSTEQREQLEEDKRAFTYAPATLSGLVFAYNMVDPHTGERITDLKLTPELLAEIFTGQIANWNDPRILDINPGHQQLPALVKPVGRADQSSLTFAMTSWWSFVASSDWTEGPREIFPGQYPVNLLSGSDPVGRAVARPGEPSPQNGIIGWMDSSVAALYGLPAVEVQNGAGFFVGPTPDSLLAGAREMLPNEDLVTLVPDAFADDPAAYALPVVTNLVVPTTTTETFTTEVGDILKPFVEYVAGAGQDEDLPIGYAPLSEDLRKLTLDAAAQIPTTPVEPPTEPQPGENPGGNTASANSSSRATTSPRSSTAADTASADGKGGGNGNGELAAGAEENPQGSGVPPALAWLLLPGAVGVGGLAAASGIGIELTAQPWWPFGRGLG